MNFLAMSLSHLLSLPSRSGAASRLGSSLNNLLMQMRKNCNHPDLIDGDASGTLEYPPADEMEAECGKLALLARVLDRLKRNKHRTLLFSQMTKMLDLFEAYFEERGIRYCRLDGSTKYEDRRARIDEFNDPQSDCFVFLLSTRAGGCVHGGGNGEEAEIDAGGHTFSFTRADHWTFLSQALTPSLRPCVRVSAGWGST